MKKRFIISTFCAGLVTIGCGYSLATSTKFPFLSLSSGATYTFALDSDNTPELTNVEKEQKEVVATGLSNLLYLNYSHASNVSGGHAKLAEGGYISNYEAINDITSLTVSGNGTFKLGYGILTITDYVSISLENTSYTLTGDDIDMNYFKLVATSDNAVVTSISGADSCTTAAEFGVRTYSTSGGTYVDGWTRLVHDVPTTQAFEIELKWLQTETKSGNANNPRFFAFDSSTAYDENDDFITNSDDTMFKFKGVQFRQDWDVDNFMSGGYNTKANYVSSRTVAGKEIAGKEGGFVDADGVLYSNGWVDDASGYIISNKNDDTSYSDLPVRWANLRKDATVTLNVTYTPGEDGSNTLDLQWRAQNNYNGTDYSVRMHQYIQIPNIENFGLAIGSGNCAWTILDASARGLN